MGNFALGFQAMFRVWDDPAVADKVRAVLSGEPAPAPAIEPPAPVPVAKPAPIRSEALTLLAALQRDARFIDFIQEPVASYTDEQIGAAVRSIHDECAKTLARIFALEPLRAEPEGAEIRVPADFDSAQFRLVGNVASGAALTGTLAHPGWRATKCELPEWTGREESALVVAPCELEVK